MEMFSKLIKEREEEWKESEKRRRRGKGRRRWNDDEESEEIFGGGCGIFATDDLSDEEVDITGPEFRMTSIISGHLCAPLYAEEIDLLLKGGEDCCSCRRHKMLLKKIEGHIGIDDLEDPISYVQGWVETIKVTKHQVDQRKVVMLTCARNWIIGKMNFMESVSALVPPESVKADCEVKLEALKRSLSELDEDLKRSIAADTVKDRITYIDIDVGHTISYMGCEFERDISFMAHFGTKRLMPTNIILCALDELQSLYCLKLYWLLTDIFDGYPGHKIYNTGVALREKFIKLRKMRAEGFFSFVASWEPLIVGYTVAQPNDLGCTELYTTQVTAMEAYLTACGNPYTIKDFLPTGDSENELRMFLELVGMVKTLGYPILKANRLLDQLKEHGTTPTYVDPTLNEETDGIGRRNFAITHFKVTGAYPVTNRAPAELLPFLLKNKRVPNKYHGKYNLWSRVGFGKTFEFDMSPDLSEISKDTAACVELKSWGSMYDRCAFMYLHGKKPPPSFYEKSTQPRRVIEAFLKAPERLVEKIVTDREKGVYDRNDHISSQCGKELEKKELTGRAFNKQTANQRYFQVTLEHNIAESIFRFVPEQSMTDGEVAIANRHMDQIREMGGTSVLINLDLTKWCLNQRVANTYLIGRMYDELFGRRGIYENSHDFFVDCNVFCNSRLAPPDYDLYGNPIPGEYFMNNFVGGFEGMHQKKWTHQTVSILNLVIERCNMNAKIMCQGDNIVIIVHFTKDQVGEMRTKIVGFLDNVREYFEAMGHKLKKSETWFSRILHEYGKQRILSGRAVPGGTKCAAAMNADINDGFSSHHASISSINTSTESLAKRSTDADVAFIMNQMMLSYYFVRKDITQSPEDARVLLLFPADFGGLPLSSYYNHCVRGHDDPITTWLSVMGTMRKHFPPIASRLIKIWQMLPVQVPSTPEERLRLYEDPYSLPIRSLPSANYEIKELTLQLLQSDYVTNPVVKKLFDSSFSEDKMDLVSKLDTMVPCYPQLGNVLLKNSNAGIGEAMQSKFTQTKTIERVAQGYRGVSLVELIRRSNDETRAELKKRLARNNREMNERYLNVSGCPYVVAEKLRADGWGKEFMSLTKPCHQHQAKLMKFDDVRAEEVKRTIVIQTSDQLREDSKNYSNTFGPYKGFICKRTKEKTVKASVDVAQKTTYTRSLKTIGKMKSWMELIGAKNLEKLCDVLIDEKLKIVDLPGEDIRAEDLFEKIKGGTIQHRLQTSTEHGTAIVNHLLTLTSHYSQSSNHLSTITADGEDYSIFFQMLYSTNIAVLNLASKFLDEMPAEIGCVLECTTCTHLLPEAKLDIAPFGRIGSVEPLYQTPSPVVVVTPVENVNEMMECVMGMYLAKAVEGGHAVFHSCEKSTKGSHNPSRPELSLNDLRRSNLKRVIMAMCMYSPHCHQLAFEDNKLITSSSNDLSFTSVAEIIINADLRAELFHMMGRDVGSHTMVTQPGGLSAYMSRHIKDLMHENVEGLKDVLRFTFPEDIYSWSTRHALSAFIGMVGKYRLLPPGTNLRSAKHALNLGNVSLCKKLLHINHITPSFPVSSLLTIWRSQDFANRIAPEPVPQLDINFSSGASYPNSIVQSYFTSKADNSHFAHARYDFLSFLSRIMVAISSANNKYCEVLISTGLIDMIHDSERSVISMAEGSGGTFSFLMLLTRGNGYYNTWMSPKIDNRYSATDRTAPACHVVGIPKSRLPEGQNLSRGETNILTDGFLAKLESTLQVDPPIIVTMDAESVKHGTNIEFVVHLIPTLIRYNVPIIMFKMFYDPILEGVIPRYVPKSHTWLIAKPITSNPVGREVILLIVGPDIPVKNLEFHRVIHQTISSDHERVLGPLSNVSMDLYIDASMQIRDMIKKTTIFNPLRFGGKKRISGTCGLCCHRHFELLADAIDAINNHEDYDNVEIIVRANGTNETLAIALYDFTFIACVLTKGRDKSLSQILNIFNNYTLDRSCVEEFRKTKTLEDCPSFPLKFSLTGGTFLREWNDVKFFMREWDESRCKCEGKFRRMKAYDWEKSLSRRYLSGMGQMRMVQGPVSLMNYFKKNNDE